MLSSVGKVTALKSSCQRSSTQVSGEGSQYFPAVGGSIRIGQPTDKEGGRSRSADPENVFAKLRL
jgi:hypothetical protein